MQFSRAAGTTPDPRQAKVRRSTAPRPTWRRYLEEWQGDHSRRQRDQDFIRGVDLGQTTDFTAIAIIERMRMPTGDMNDLEIVNHPERFTYESQYHLRYLDRPIWAPITCPSSHG